MMNLLFKGESGMRVLLSLFAAFFSFSSFAEKSVAKASWESLPSKSWEKIQIEDWVSARLAQQIRRVLNSDEFIVTAQVDLLSEAVKNQTWNLSGLPKDIFKRIDRIQVQIQIPSRSSAAEEKLIQALPAQVMAFVHPAKISLDLKRVSVWGGGFWKKLLALDQSEKILTYISLLLFGLIAFAFLQLKKMWSFLKQAQGQSVQGIQAPQFSEAISWPEIEIKLSSKTHPVFENSDQVLKTELAQLDYETLLDLVAGLAGSEQSECLRLLDQVDPVISKVLMTEIQDLPELALKERTKKSKALLQNLSDRVCQSASAKSFALPQARINLLKAFSIHP